MSTIPTRTLSAINPEPDFARVIIQRRAVGPKDVHIKISYAGICHSDIHSVKGEWGPKEYPQCVGHEIIGSVVAVGEEVTKFQVGDFAGVGCFTDSCRECRECKAGDQNYCIKGQTGTYCKKTSEAHSPGGVTQGGYSSDIVVDEDYTLKVPASMHRAEAAPLLCAGITCFSPFQHYGLKAGMRLGIYGLGGLGHMGVKIAKAMGAHVTVFSRTTAKRETALAMGADEFVVSTDEKAMAGVARSLDMIYNSVAFPHNVKQALGLLRSSGTMIMVGGIPQSLDVSGFDLLGRRLKLVGSCIGGIPETQQMIDFCAEHKILCEIESIPPTPEAVETAYRRAERSDVKYRFVMDIRNLTEPTAADIKKVQDQAKKNSAASLAAAEATTQTQGTEAPKRSTSMAMVGLVVAAAAVATMAFLRTRKN
jgi:uncharacterized zinc-type alcohol dehydrogenase-like protein